MPNHTIIPLLQIHQGFPAALKIKTKISKMAIWVLQDLASIHLYSLMSQQLSSSKMIELVFRARTLYAVLSIWNSLLQPHSLATHHLPSYLLKSHIISSSGKPSLTLQTTSGFLSLKVLDIFPL